MTSLIARGRYGIFLCLISLALLSGCASTNNPRDPLEPLNRVVYKFNDALDRAMMKPIATGYQAILPQFVRTGVTNFFNNLSDILTALNNLLQGKVTDAASDLGRVALNSTVGIAGLIDVGTEVGLEKHREDFGQTLGRWGMDSGPYLQMPFFGPSSFRDAVGSFVDFKLDPVRWIWRNDIPTRNSLWGLYYVNLRANLLDSTKILDEAALDPYEFQRDAYLQRRRNLVYDGNPPPENDEDEIPDLKTKPRTDSDDAAPAAPGAATESPHEPVAAAPADTSSTNDAASAPAPGDMSVVVPPAEDAAPASSTAI